MYALCLQLQPPLTCVHAGPVQAAPKHAQEGRRPPDAMDKDEAVEDGQPSDLAAAGEAAAEANPALAARMPAPAGATPDPSTLPYPSAEQVLLQASTHSPAAGERCVMPAQHAA
jgi:hypothetical protein